MQDKEEMVTISLSESLKKQGKFTMVPHSIIECGLSMQAKMVWIELYKYCYNDGPIFPGMKRMAKNLVCSQSTIYRHRKELEAAKLVVVKGRNGIKQTNEYVLHSPDEYECIDDHCAPMTDGHHAPVTDAHHAPVTDKEDRVEEEKIKNI